MHAECTISNFFLCAPQTWRVSHRWQDQIHGQERNGWLGGNRDRISLLFFLMGSFLGERLLISSLSTATFHFPHHPRRSSSTVDGSCELWGETSEY
ncbi:unnamed protein product [Linum tenue]|uniref:Uncharacterized protein n=1 Tax=Linum tenue TaxID=586396 RepID=A0AAV0PTY0_9ROSI|nr:unnamed protein product [Linum tenue]